MRSFTNVFLTGLLCAAIAGCGGGGEEPAAEDSAAEAGEPPALEADTQAPPEPEPIPLPEGFPESVPMLKGLEITSAEILDAGKGMFKVVGASTLAINDILEHYEAVFSEGGWTEDMLMDNEGMTIISAIKDGLLVTVESNKGGLGSIVTITTGNL